MHVEFYKLKPKYTEIWKGEMPSIPSVGHTVMLNDDEEAGVVCRVCWTLSSSIVYVQLKD